MRWSFTDPSRKEKEKFGSSRKHASNVFWCFIVPLNFIRVCENKTKAKVKL